MTETDKKYDFGKLHALQEQKSALEFDLMKLETKIKSVKKVLVETKNRNVIKFSESDKSNDILQFSTYMSERLVLQIASDRGEWAMQLNFEQAKALQRFISEWVEYAETHRNGAASEKTERQTLKWRKHEARALDPKFRRQLGGYMDEFEGEVRMFLSDNSIVIDTDEDQYEVSLSQLMHDWSNYTEVSAQTEETSK